MNSMLSGRAAGWPRLPWRWASHTQGRAGRTECVKRATELTRVTVAVWSPWKAANGLLESARRARAAAAVAVRLQSLKVRLELGPIATGPPGWKVLMAAPLHCSVTLALVGMLRGAAACSHSISLHCSICLFVLVERLGVHVEACGGIVSGCVMQAQSIDCCITGAGSIQSRQ